MHIMRKMFVHFKIKVSIFANRSVLLASVLNDPCCKYHVKHPYRI